ncbi:MAG: hypothetical protein ABR562_00085 [Thermoplasmatota archaeon]
MNPSSKFAAAVAIALLVGVGVTTAALNAATKTPSSGPVRITLEGSAPPRWNSFVQVFDGSFSAELDQNQADQTSKVTISPVNIPLKNLHEAQITFWTYFQTDHETGGHLWVPHVELVLDNGRWLTGDQNTSPVGAAKAALTAIHSEDGQGYPSANLWTQMAVQACGLGDGQCGFYSDYAGADPLVNPAWNINQPHNLADWAADPDFAGAKVVQVRIAYGGDPSAACNGGCTAYIDNASIGGRLVKIEPETASTGGP